MPAVLNSADLISGNDAAYYRGLPVIVRSNQSPNAVVQLQRRIGQCIGNVIWRRR